MGLSLMQTRRFVIIMIIYHTSVDLLTACTLSRCLGHLVVFKKDNILKFKFVYILFISLYVNIIFILLNIQFVKSILDLVSGFTSVNICYCMSKIGKCVTYVSITFSAVLTIVDLIFSLLFIYSLSLKKVYTLSIPIMYQYTFKV